MQDATDSSTTSSRSLLQCGDARQLRERQNSLAPLCRLPVEIVVEIFRLIGDPRRIFELHAIRHTCRALNSISLSTPQLWSYVNLEWHPEWVAVCCQRAHPVPLCLVAFKIHKLLTADLLPPLFHLSSVIRWGSQAQSESELASTFIRLLNSPAPLVKIVTYLGSWSEPAMFALTPQLLGGNCSNLTILYVERVDLDDTSTLPSLETLSISYSQATFSGCRRIVQRAPNLKYLTLNTIALEETPQNTDEIITIDLPRLVTLAIDQAQNEALPFLRLLPNPSQRFEIQGTPGSDGVWTGAGVGEDSVIPTRLQQFWHAATGAAQLPPMKLDIHSSYTAKQALEDESWMNDVTYHLRVGRSWSRVPEVEPSLWWMTKCEIIQPHPLLDLVTEFWLYPEGGRIYLGDPELLDIDLFKNLEYARIDDAYEDERLWERYGIADFTMLGKWLADRADAGKRLQNLEISKHCREEVKSAAHTLGRLGLVENVYWDE
jgi:hypothetical protein